MKKSNTENESDGEEVRTKVEKLRVRRHREIFYKLNLQAPRFLYIGQAFRYSPQNAFYIFNQQIYFII